MAETFYIYEIPGVKIGCTGNIKRRGYEYEEDLIILEAYTDIEQASKRERELQEAKGYRIDNVPFTHTYEISKARKGRYMPGCKTKNSKISRKVAAYKNGKLVNLFPSMAATARELEIGSGNLDKFFNPKYNLNHLKGYWFIRE